MECARESETASKLPCLSNVEQNSIHNFAHRLSSRAIFKRYSLSSHEVFSFT